MVKLGFMDAFIYNNIWLAVTYWAIIIATVIYVILVMTGSQSKFVINSAISLFCISTVALTVFGYAIVDRGKATDAYQEQISNFIKGEGGFDRVSGEVNFDAVEEPSVYKVFVEDEGEEKEGACYVQYPEDTSKALEFACGFDFVPLKDAKADLIETANAIAKEEAAAKKAPVADAK